MKSDPLADCEVCGKPFMRRTTLHRVCGPTCAGKLVKAAKRERQEADKAQRRALAKRRESLKPLSAWKDDAQRAINKYVRLRDHGLPCISCDRPADWDGQWHASHFRSVGAASAVRYSLWNIHKACSVCNNWKSGNLSEYEPRLRAKIGDAKVDWLRAQNHRAHYSVEYLQRLKAVFAKRCRRLEQRLENRDLPL